MFIVVFGLSSSLAFAQLGIGARVGLNLANVSNIDNSELNPGFHVAGFAVLGSGFKSFQPELVLTQKGNGLDFPDTKFRINVNYLQINALYTPRFELGGFGVNLLAGPYVGYAAFGSSVIGDDRNSIDDWDGINRIDIGLQFGAGVSVPLGPGSLVADVRFGLGLTDTREDVPDNADRFSNRVFGIGVGYKFGL